MTTPQPQPSLTSLPRLEDLPQTGEGAYEAEGVREAFESFRRHALQLQAQLRVLQAAGKTGTVEPTLSALIHVAPLPTSFELSTTVLALVTVSGVEVLHRTASTV